MKADDVKPRKNSFQFSIKAVMILTIVVAAYFAGKIPEQRRAQKAELKARNQAERAMMAEREARVMAERSMQQAQMALQQARRAQALLAAEQASANESSK